MQNEHMWVVISCYYWNYYFMGHFVHRLVALNRKLGFPSREIDIQWKKGKQPENVALFNLYGVLFQLENRMAPDNIKPSTSVCTKVVFARKT